MSMTLNSMSLEVSKILGGQNDNTLVTLAQSAIKASIEDFNSAKYWNFLLKDTSTATIAAAGDLTTASPAVAPLSTGGFDFVNVGQTVTISTVGTNAPTLPASTTVSSVTRGTDGVITSITLSANFTTSGSPSVGSSLSFSADIPIRVAINEYNLPLDFLAPHGARLLTDKRQLAYIKYREWNRKVVDQSSAGSVEAYTAYNPQSAQTQNYGRYRMRVFRTPATADTLHLQYFRFMDPDATTVDIPNRFLRKLIDYAQWRLQRLKNAADERLPSLEAAAKAALMSAMTIDEELGEDEDVRLISQMEAWNGDRPLWGNGAFYPWMD